MGEMLRVRRDFLRKTGMHSAYTTRIHPVHTSEVTSPGDGGQKAIDPPGGAIGQNSDPERMPRIDRPRRAYDFTHR